MPELPINILPFYQGWEEYQDKLIEALKPLTLEQLALRPAPHLRSIGENAAHIVATRVAWFYFFMGVGDPSLAPIDQWDQDGAPARTSAELVEGFQTTWTMIDDALKSWTPADLEYVFEETRQGKLYQRTRGWVVWHMVEHDLHHGGEISFTLGTNNLKAPDL